MDTESDELCDRAEQALAARPSDAEADPRQLLVAETALFAREFQRWADAQVKDDGMTLPGLRLVERLHCQGPAMMRTLADELGLSPRNVTALVDALEDDGLVARRSHPTDRRAILVALTADGVTAADALIAPRILAMGALFEALDDGECEQFSGLIGRLRSAIAGGTPAGPPRGDRSESGVAAV
jgi:DNA-binding MarR family transcriptional regulator